MAVPGPAIGGRNRGAHALLKDGARLVEDASDILAELGLSVGRQPHLETINPSASLLADWRPGEAWSVGELETRSGIEGAELLKQLTELELEGAVERSAGGRFIRRG
jgi:DNA processing protein